MTQQEMIDWFIERNNEPATLQQIRDRFVNAEKLMWRLAREIEILGGYLGPRAYKLNPAFYASILESREGKMMA